MYEPEGFALQIFQSRHAAHPNETWAEACDRVAVHMSNAEDGEDRAIYRDEFNEALRSNRLMPGGRIWYGSGRAKGQLLNCFVIGTNDSREGWGKSVSDSIVISGTGGGVGLNCSPVRPKGQPVRGTGGTATGAVSLMEIINAAGEVIKAGGGRRTALMLCLNLSHGDVTEFLDKKLDLKQLNNANVSVVFDQDPEGFFQLVRDGADFPMMFQGKQVGTIPAAELWMRIVKNALAGGEPGLLNGHLANKMSNIWYLEPLTSTNPCFHPDTRIATDQGLVRIEDLAKQGRTVNVVADRRVGKGDVLRDDVGTVLLPAFDVEIKQHSAAVFKVTTEHGYSVTATSEHTFITTSGRKRLADLVPGDTLMLPSGEGAFGNAGTYEDGVSIARRQTQDEVPERVWRGSRDMVLGYLHGVFLTRSWASLKPEIRFGGHSTQMRQVQTLLTTLGVVSWLRVAGDSAQLVVRTCLLEHEGTFEQVLFSNRLVEKHVTEVLSVAPAGTSAVYCLTQPETNCVISDGIVNGQCGEIWMSAYDCCCLAALVLPRFLKNGTVDWPLLSKTIATGVRFLDDVLTVNNYPLPEIAAKCAQLRRIGLGVTGLHDMLLELGLQYNSSEGLEFVDKLMKFIKNESYEASVNLAVVKGSFPGFDAGQYLKSAFVKTLKPSLREHIKKHGIRNCALNTIAPTGTISIVSGVSSGIEPIFAPAYERRYRKGDEKAVEVVVHPLFQQFVKAGRSTKHFQGAHELSMRDHLEMQRVCQVHIDNAVSKTINLPSGTSAEALSDLYMEYLPDLKGVTVYPDGSREDQPLTPISLEAAEQHAFDAVSAAAGNENCKSGVCDV